MNTVSSLIPRPIPVRTDAVEGELRINGSIERNVIQFRFRFADPAELAPLLLVVRAAGKSYRYYCTIRDTAPDGGAEIITPVFSAEFCVGQCFTLTVEPLAGLALYSG